MLEDVEQPQPRAGEVLVRVETAGLNFLDTYHRTGLYQVRLPLTLGQEGCGIIEAVGDDVTWFSTGQRVAWATGPGSFAE